MQKSAGQYWQDHLIYVQFLLIGKTADEQAIYAQRLLWNADQIVKTIVLNQDQKAIVASLLKTHMETVIECIFKRNVALLDTGESAITKLADVLRLASDHHKWHEQLSIYLQLLSQTIETYQKHQDVARMLSQFDYGLRNMADMGYWIDQLTVKHMTVAQIKVHLRNIHHNIVLGLRHGQLNMVHTELAKFRSWMAYESNTTTISTTEEDKRTFQMEVKKWMRIWRQVCNESDQIPLAQKRSVVRALSHGA